jgi:hypothetical protein
MSEIKLSHIGGTPQELGATVAEEFDGLGVPSAWHAAQRLAAGRSPQPICSASSTMIPSGPRT